MKHKNFFIVPNQIFELVLKPKEFVVHCVLKSTFTPPGEIYLPFYFHAKVKKLSNTVAFFLLLW